MRVIIEFNKLSTNVASTKANYEIPLSSHCCPHYTTQSAIYSSTALQDNTGGKKNLMQIHNEQQLIIALWAIMFTNETTELVVWRERELNEILAY